MGQSEITRHGELESLTQALSPSGRHLSLVLPGLRLFLYREPLGGAEEEES